ncbi:YcjX family protein [Bartonella tamiae]|uniref:YcjX family protein n=1 Tax=Bartonella tamiae Th239 TaxID=1094558 RepID=J1JW34_9HYPH|nr:YcjX family protein [Bartonella tamiae]EJF88790.1 hypothetical protein ME5_01341 [Bartonella tamiae Th239]EJF94960.1 hypothetical protein MEG_00541 [Bartonella tamiae Th307]
MLLSFTTIKDETLIAWDSVTDRASDLFNPTIRLGVTGLSTAGKTVFITAFIQNLLRDGRLPMFEVVREGRLTKVTLGQQPNNKVSRFEYEKHLNALMNDQIWPQSTRSLSQLRLELHYTPKPSIFNVTSRNKLTIDILDYPGEWLLDLPLLYKSYRDFSREAIERARSSNHIKHADEWLAHVQTINILKNAQEDEIDNLSTKFKDYLKSAKNDNLSFSSLSPGRFLIPGQFDGAQVLNFCPLPHLDDKRITKNSLADIMEQRYEAYKSVVIKPFFREYIVRLDRQVVLIDALQAMNAGENSVLEMEQALSEILHCFRLGKKNWIHSLWQHKIDRLLIAATKADHLHHENHDNLQTITSEIVAKAIAYAKLNGTKTESLAIASIRTTREGLSTQHNENLPVVIGTPMPHETIAGTQFDGTTQTAIFPGDLPNSLEQLLNENWKNHLNFVNFRPPKIDKKSSFPHIRLDRAMQFLLGDYLS